MSSRTGLASPVENQACGIAKYPRLRDKFGTDGTFPATSFESQPKEKRGAAHTLFIRAELSWATRFPGRCCDTVTTLCRFTAHGDFMPSSDCAQVATTRPPAARMTSPVIQADSSDARNTASGAISVTRPSRPSGVFSARTAPAPPSKVPAATLPSVSV